MVATTHVPLLGVALWDIEPQAVLLQVRAIASWPEIGHVRVRAATGQVFEGGDATLAAAGQTLFVDNCAACHTETGAGDRTQGAPALNDAIWLYGGDRETVTATVQGARYGVMPSWAGRLSEDEIRAVAAYVHSLGGGE